MRPSSASACIVVLTLFLVAGNWLSQFFGITVPAFQIMGGIIFFTNALKTLIEREALDPGEVSWWNIPVTLTQSLVYALLVLWLAMFALVSTSKESLDAFAALCGMR